MPIPELDAIVVQKNEENLTVVEDDMPGKTRTVCFLFKCPFSIGKNAETQADTCVSCSKQSWNRSNCWSLESPEHVIGYLLHHATTSNFHQLDLREAYDILVSKWADLEWTYYENTFEDREEGRALSRNKRRRVEIAL